jgi:hypothetical protein
VSRSQCVLIVLTFAAGACGARGPALPTDIDDGQGDGDGPVVQEGIVGTWDLVAIDGAPVSGPSSLRWQFTETTYTALTATCTETGTYAYAADTLRATTEALSGTGCTGAVGATGAYAITVDATTLTATIPDAETGGSTTFTFRRV